MPNASQNMGKVIIVAGLVIMVIGLGVYFSDRLPWLGRLPGDIAVKRENFSFYFPLGTSILLSVIISVILYLIRRFG